MTTDLSAEQAIRAWTRRHSGTWTESDEVELRAWLAASPEHQAAYDRVARVWASAGDLGSYVRRNEISPRRYGRRVLLAACVAGALAVGAVPLWRAGHSWWAGAPQHWIAGRDKPREFVLDDGTRVLLDAGSELVAKIGWHARSVSLRGGEALFTVAHEASRPFEVEVGPGRVTDLGTRFDVEVTQGAARVAVLEGRVGVSTPHGSVSLVAGSGGGYNRDGVLLPVEAVDSSVTLWSAGRRRFVAEPLSAVLERLTRYNDVTFVFADPRLRDLRVSGTFRVDDLSLFLRTLGAALPLEARWLGPKSIQIGPREGPPGTVTR